MKRLFVTLLFIFRAFSSGAVHSQADSISGLDLGECEIIQAFGQTWKNSPLVAKERAVWIVKNSAGNYSSIEWHQSPQPNITIWSGAIPDGVVAQAHTHGDHLNPLPSEQDISEARRLHIFIYTLTRKGIWRAAPDGSITKEAERGWFKSSSACQN